MKIGLRRSIILSQRNKNKFQARNRLNDNLIQPDKTEVDTMEIKEITMKDVNKKIDSLDSLKENYFKEGFDFVTMENQYTLKMILESAQDLEFDVFDLQIKSQENEMYIFGMHILAKEKYMEEFKISNRKLQNFLYALQNSYNPIAYHNKTHATDVSQTCYYYMHTCDLINICRLTRVEQLSMLLAGFMHDTDHPGFNNVFMVNTSSPIAIRYNDRAVLENYHVAMGFKILKGNRQ